MRHGPAVSVVVPAHNTPAILPRHNLLAEFGEPFETVLMDHASTDSSVRLLQSLTVDERRWNADCLLDTNGYARSRT